MLLQDPGKQILAMIAETVATRNASIIPVYLGIRKDGRT
jgi:hypothetical protein